MLGAARRRPDPFLDFFDPCSTAEVDLSDEMNPGGWLVRLIDERHVLLATPRRRTAEALEKVVRSEPGFRDVDTGRLAITAPSPILRMSNQAGTYRIEDAIARNGE